MTRLAREFNKQWVFILAEDLEGSTNFLSAKKG